MEFEVRTAEEGRLVAVLDSHNAAALIAKAKGKPIIGGYRLVDSISFDMGRGYTFYFWAGYTVKMKM